MTVAELTLRLGADELAEWMAYSRLCDNPRAFDTVDDQLMAFFGRRLKGGSR